MSAAAAITGLRLLQTRQRLPGYRRVLAHPVAITMEAEHAVAALEEAFAKYGLPDVEVR